MGTPPMVLTEAELSEALAARIRMLTEYVTRKMPAGIRARVSPEDVLQEVFIAAHRNREHFTGGGPHALDRWLITIVRTKLVDAIRAAQQSRNGPAQRRKRQAQARLASLSRVLTRLVSPERTPSKQFSMREAGHRVAIALLALDEPHRQAFELRYVQELPCAEIARLMNRTIPAVNSLIYNAKRMLRELLGGGSKYLDGR